MIVPYRILASIAFGGSIILPCKVPYIDSDEVFNSNSELFWHERSAKYLYIQKIIF